MNAHTKPISLISASLLLGFFVGCGNETPAPAAQLIQDPGGLPDTSVSGTDSKLDDQDVQPGTPDAAQTDGDMIGAGDGQIAATADAIDDKDAGASGSKDAKIGDAGLGTKDAGASEDGGVSQKDAGAGTDAGANTDAGSTKKDAGAPNPTCQDNDKDGYGMGCAAGPDCNDNNPNFAVICPDCTKDNFKGCACKQAAANCYSGDPAWVGKGLCQAGVRLCQKGFWSDCKSEVLPSPEVCDGKDNNCNGLIDEGVLSSCGTCDMSCTQQNLGPDYGNPFDPSKESSNGVGINKQGYIYLDAKTANVDLNHIWIAGTGAKVISKLNTKTGKEVARYSACTSASRTSVDINGDVWVGCRSGGLVMKIMNKITDCIDKNGNGTIETSKDTNGNGQIEAGEMKPYNQDECVRFIVKPIGSENTIRAAGVDKDNYAWVGGWNTKMLARLHPKTGATVDTISLGCNPYGLVIDQKGIIWISGRGCSSLVRADPKTKQVTKVGNGGKGSPYGINVDMYGRIWIANTNGWTSRYDPVTNKWNPVAHNMRSRGVATSNDGHVYVALDTTSTVAKINAVTLTTVGYISLGSSRYPVGIAVDYDGYVWAVNQSKSTASKLDPKTMQVVGEYSVGKSPYTYSDMTGYTLNNYTAPKGQYTHVFGFSSWSGTVNETKTTTVWEKIDVDATVPPKGYLKVRYMVADTLAELKTGKWSSSLGPFPPMQFPIDLTKGPKIEGRFLKVEVFLQAGTDKISPIVKSIKAKGKQVAVP